MKSYKTPTFHCPRCQHKLDRVTPSDDSEAARKPEENDFTICIQCGEILVFSKDLSLELMAKKDLKALYKEDRQTFFYLHYLQREIRSIKK
jgi:hypothetical protein